MFNRLCLYNVAIAYIPSYCYLKQCGSLVLTYPFILQYKSLIFDNKYKQAMAELGQAQATHNSSSVVVGVSGIDLRNSWHNVIDSTNKENFLFIIN